MPHSLMWRRAWRRVWQVSQKWRNLKNEPFFCALPPLKYFSPLPRPSVARPRSWKFQGLKIQARLLWNRSFFGQVLKVKNGKKWAFFRRLHWHGNEGMEKEPSLFERLKLVAGLPQNKSQEWKTEKTDKKRIAVRKKTDSLKKTDSPEKKRIAVRKTG